MSYKDLAETDRKTRKNSNIISCPDGEGNTLTTYNNGVYLLGIYIINHNIISIWD